MFLITNRTNWGFPEGFVSILTAGDALVSPHPATHTLLILDVPLGILPITGVPTDVMGRTSTSTQHHQTVTAFKNIRTAQDKLPTHRQDSIPRNQL